jgi:hypothetical protein
MSGIMYLMPWTKTDKDYYSRRLFGTQEYRGMVCKVGWMSWRSIYGEGGIGNFWTANKAMQDCDERFIAYEYVLVSKDEEERFRKLELLK